MKKFKIILKLVKVILSNKLDKFLLIKTLSVIANELASVNKANYDESQLISFKYLVKDLEDFKLENLGKLTENIRKNFKSW